MTKPIEPGCKAMIIRAAITANLWRVVEVVRFLGVFKAGEIVHVPEMDLPLVVLNSPGEPLWVIKGDLWVDDRLGVIDISGCNAISEFKLLRLWDEEEGEQDAKEAESLVENKKEQKA